MPQSEHSSQDLRNEMHLREICGKESEKCIYIDIREIFVLLSEKYLFYNQRNTVFIMLSVAIIRCLPPQSEPAGPLNLPPFTPDTACLSHSVVFLYVLLEYYFSDYKQYFSDNEICISRTPPAYPIL